MVLMQKRGRAADPLPLILVSVSLRLVILGEMVIRMLAVAAHIQRYTFNLTNGGLWPNKKGSMFTLCRASTVLILRGAFFVRLW